MTTRKTEATWRPPTRRVFVGMLAAAATALVVRGPARLGPPDATPVADENLERRAHSTTLWIGHC